ncbi:HK97 family phage prohead protease [Mesorhizobium sp. J428]|uniref:HK97 family phage prohead protease n=1 Tax=Mesorhizobium sp. J428 TaxID=2898440 RepID=UPI0021507617|nr:HK97 family phage prohead protease [Mesorhizobium sp. J428]MCR5856568.1 HK97 family phage prohead protease [Mesorhizobium sp. J428]
MERLFLETKILADDAGTISGIAWKYDVADRVGDMIEPGAFAKAAFPLPMLFGHDGNDPVGTWTEGTDKAGAWHLKGRLLVEDVSRAREVSALVKSGAVRGLSIGFRTVKSATRAGGGRIIKALEMFEVSLVTIPMHPGARVTSAKSAVQALAIADVINRAAAQIAAR